MAIDGQKAEKLRGFLQQLTPRARAMLLAELERSEQRGERLPGTELIMRELRLAEKPVEKPAAKPAASIANAAPEMMLPEGPLPDRDGNATRLFFAFVEPFLVDDEPENIHQGRLSRSNAMPIWEWICRDLMPGEATAYIDNVVRLLAAGEQGRASQAASGFQDRVVQAADKLFTSAASDDKARRKIAHQIGTPRALEDVRYLMSLLKSRDVLAVLAGKMPAKIRNLSDDQIASVTAFIDSTAGRHKEVYVMGLVLVMSRLAAPWQLIRVAVKAADSDFPARIVETPYAPAVPIVLSELERLVRELESDLQRGQAMAQPSLLKDIHDAARGLRTELDLSADSGWARQLAAIRGQLAVALRPEIESAPGRLRRMLRDASLRRMWCRARCSTPATSPTPRR